MEILPTYHCFDDAMDLIAERIKEDADRARSLLVVHGVAVAEDGTRYAHAWVEDGPLCWDAGILNGTRIWYAAARDEYYAARRIEHSTAYTLQQAWEENVRTGMYGPWREDYLLLCGRSRRVLGRFQAVGPKST